MKYPYNGSYYPPIPELKVRLVAPEAGLSTAFLDAIIDTGADATIIPTDYLHKIKASAEDNARLRSPLGDYRTVRMYMIDVQIDDRTLPGIWVVGDEVGDEIVLGRNVINKMRLLLDGFASQTEILYI